MKIGTSILNLGITKKEILQSQNFVDYQYKYEFNLDKSIELNISLSKKRSKKS